MTKPRTIALGFGEHIIAVVPEQASGPGWANQPVWVHIRRADGKLRTECLQPAEQSHELHTLFAVGALVCRQLAGAVAVKQLKEART